MGMAKSILKVLLGAALLMIVLSAPAYADTIVVLSGSGWTCGGSDCFGNVLTLTIHPVSGNDYTVTLSIDTSGNTNAGAGIAGVDFKFGLVTAATLTSFNGGSTAGWATVTNGLNAKGCTNGGGFFGCSADTAFLAGTGSPLAPIATNGSTGTYTWVWDVTATGWNGSPYGIHVGADFGHILTSGPHAGDFQTNGLISATSAVPEPGSLMLFGTGLIALAGILRRRLS